jgi:hypothetical protein
MRPGDAPVEVEVYITRAKDGEKAILVRAGEVKHDVWIPRSCIHEDNELDIVQGCKGTLTVKRWFVDIKGLE